MVWHERSKFRLSREGEVDGKGQVHLVKKY